MTKPNPDLAEAEQRLWALGNGPSAAATWINLLMTEYDRRADRDQLHADVERLRQRSHQIQADEMAKRAALDAEIATLRQRWANAKRWTEQVGLRAEWATDPTMPFWSMTSMNARDALAGLVHDRDTYRAALTELRAASRGLAFFDQIKCARWNAAYQQASQVLGLEDET